MGICGAEERHQHNLGSEIFFLAAIATTYEWAGDHNWHKDCFTKPR
jgi:hypothetical protein